MTFSDYFSVQVFFLVFRETLETAVIVSVLLSFLKRGFGEVTGMSERNKKVYNALVWQVWLGAAAGLLICVIVGAVFVSVFYMVGTNLWDKTEKLWEAFFCIVASVMITYMGISMLRINKMQAKWRLKLARIIVDTHEDELVEMVPSVKGRLRFYSKKYSLAILPMVTTLREGLEAIMFLGGLGAKQPSTSFPLAVVCAIALGTVVGIFMYRWGDSVSIRAFLIVSTCFLYLVSAGLFSRGVWFYEMYEFIKKVGSDVAESGSGPGSYDIKKSVWHVNCCNPETDGPWMIFNALLGWQNSATYGSVISYNLYWLFVIFMVVRLKKRERDNVKTFSSPDDEELIARATGLMSRHRSDDVEERSHSLDSNTPLINNNDEPR